VGVGALTISHFSFLISLISTYNFVSSPNAFLSVSANEDKSKSFFASSVFVIPSDFLAWS
jgi:hypothetical protein